MSRHRKKQSRNPAGRPRSSEPVSILPTEMMKGMIEDLLAAGATPEDLTAALLAAPGGIDPLAGVLGGADFGFGPGQPPTLLPSPSEPVTFRVRVELDDIEPVIWRQLDLAGDLTLPDGHRVVASVIGWADVHLHHFVMGPDRLQRGVQPFVTVWAEQEGDIPPGGILERDVRLDQVVASPGHLLFHSYDFGDGWEHTLTVQEVRPRRADEPGAVLLDGRRAAPPEDCGGVPGFLDVLALFDGGEVQFHDAEHLREWLPPGYDPAYFSVTEANAYLAQVLSAADGPGALVQGELGPG